MQVYDSPLCSDPQAKLLSNGASSLKEVELLAITLNSVLKEDDALDVAKLMLKEK